MGTELSDTSSFASRTTLSTATSSITSLTNPFFATSTTQSATYASTAGEACQPGPLPFGSLTTFITPSTCNSYWSPATAAPTAASVADFFYLGVSYYNINDAAASCLPAGRSTTRCQFNYSPASDCPPGYTLGSSRQIDGVTATTRQGACMQPRQTSAVRNANETLRLSRVSFSVTEHA